ncbi:MAG: hypothetical protein RMM98_18155 [Acidobacteriota bacterium]|nr:hypothetical protein [Blastocatellia bacterium]MDW8241529.1 hypothetical protein [Acidobacteriota bacterium]
MNMASASLRDIEESLYTEVVTLEEYLRMYAHERDNIESAEIIPLS